MVVLRLHAQQLLRWLINFVLGSNEAFANPNLLVKTIAVVVSMICLSDFAKFQSKVEYSGCITATPSWLSMN